MELSYFLAQLFGLSLAIFGAVGVLRPQLITETVRDFKSTPFTNLIFGFMSIVTGLAITLSHNVWDSSWRVIITLIGWVGLIKGVIFLLKPDLLFRIGRGVYQNESQTRLILFIAFLFGAYIAYKGFGN